jgi:hypothetical protein
MLGHISCLAPNQHDSEQHALWLAARGTRGRGGMFCLLPGAVVLDSSASRVPSGKREARDRRVGGGEERAVLSYLAAALSLGSGRITTKKSAQAVCLATTILYPASSVFVGCSASAPIGLACLLHAFQTRALHASSESRSKP